MNDFFAKKKRKKTESVKHQGKIGDNSTLFFIIFFNKKRQKCDLFASRNSVKASVNFLSQNLHWKKTTRKFCSKIVETTKHIAFSKMENILGL